MVDENNRKAETTPNINAGVQPEKLGKIERAEQAVKRMEEAEKRLDDKIARLSELEADRLLGSSAGGHVEPVPAKMETAKEYAEKVMRNQPTIRDGTN
jgi:cobalamin biosynthesis Mg chelatase CobN